MTDSGPLDNMLAQMEQARDIPTLRTAAYTIALERSADAHEYRGLFP
jgi:glutamate dehydrogenase (NAD(P)+)